MVMCASNCICKWCMLNEMAVHPQFKEKVDLLLMDFEPIFINMPKRQINKYYYGD